VLLDLRSAAGAATTAAGHRHQRETARERPAPVAISDKGPSIASSINNAVTRTAGLLAIAVLGLVMSHTFKSNLDRRLTTVHISVEVKREIGSQYLKLAGIEIPPNVDSATQTAARHPVQESFVAAFRQLMLIATSLALLSALIACFVIRNAA